MLAIVIPYYKLTFFEATLQSLADQTERRFKVYIGDDSSPESPVALLEKFKGKFDFSYFKFETNVGGISLVGQWERCISLIGDEDWIMILGDDDCLSVNAVEEFYKNIDKIIKNSIKVIRYSSQSINEEGEFLTPVFYHDEFETANNFFYRRNKGQTRSSLSEYVFNFNTIKEHFFYDFPLAWHSDDLAILECSNFETIFTINQAKVLVRMSNISISGRNDLELEKFKASREFYNKLLDDYPDKFNKKNLNIIFQQIENFFYKNKSTNEYLRLSYFHLKHLGFLSILKFHRRIFKN
jgi:hypothetical protein